MSKARTLADFISDGSEFADGTISVAEVSGAAPLASPTFTGTINSNGNTIINERLDVNKQGEAFRLRTGGASTQNYISIGRTAEDARITMSGGANNAIQTSAAGDLVIGANNNLLLGRIGSPYINLNSTGVVLNELGADRDFRVESDTNSNMLVVNAGDDGVVVGGTAVRSSSALTVHSSSEPIAVFVRNDIGGADTSGTTGLYLGDVSSGVIMLSREKTSINTADVVLAGEYGFNTRDERLRLSRSTATVTINGGQNAAKFASAEAVFNDDGYNRDFRVESETNTHALFLDAGNSVVGLNISEPHLYYANDLVVGATTQGGITIAGGSSDVNYMMFADLSYGDGRYRGYIEYNHGSDNFAIAASAQHRLNLSSAEAVFNEGSYNTDFRIESDAYSHIMFVDASENRVSIGHNSSAGYGSGHVLAVAGGSTQFSNFGADVTMMIRGGNYTDPHTASILLSGGSGDNGYVKDWYVSSVASGGGGAINNDLKFRYLAGGSATQYEALKLRYNGEVIVNEEGYATHDFRVESDSNSNMLVVDAGLNTVQVGTTLTYGGPMNVEAGGIGMGESGSAGYYRRIYWNAPNNEMRFWNGTNEARISSGGAFVDASDESLKKDIDDIDYGIETVKSLQPRKYKMKDTGAEQVGFIAQEMETQVPEVVSTGITPDGDEQKGISYGQLTAVLTKAMQEQQTMIETLEARIAALESPQP